jgi:hypothetical protein
MERRPLLNETAGEVSRLATQFPNWDLLPPHTLLVRRRFGQAAAPKTLPKAEAVAARQAAIPVPRPTAPAPPPVPPVEAPPSRVLCQQCHEPMEDGASFCSECGAKQG